MKQALSIDNFLDAHRGNIAIELVGKVTIARALLEAERNSYMYFDTTQEKGPPHDTIFETWYNKFFQVLTEGRWKDELDGIFDFVSFITFNYDRCIEHFLVYSFRNYYTITEQESRDLLNRLKIFHPFGMVGHLDWLGVNPGTTRFGESDEPDLLKIAAQIRTFNERMDDEQVLASIRTEVEKAEVIVFLGFAFHQQNIDLMRPGKLCAAKRIFATAKGISQSDCAVIEQELHKLVGTDHVRIDIRDLTCTGLFDEYWRTLTRL